MNILIIGAGEVGFHLASHMAMEGQDVVVLDPNEAALQRVAEAIDVQTVVGSGSNPLDLKTAGLDDSDMLIAVTDSDEVNVVACMLATRAGKPGAVRIARVRQDALAEEAQRAHSQFRGVDLTIHPERLTAEKIHRLLKVPDASEIFDFANGRVLVLGVRISSRSAMAGRSMAEIAAGRSAGQRVLFGGLLRGSRLLIPHGDTVVEAGDVAYVVTRPDRLDWLLEQLATGTKPTDNVVVVGGTPIGDYLAQRLESDAIECKLLIEDEDACRVSSERLMDTVVLHGEATDRALLEQEFIGDADAFIAAGPDDERNILSALLARQLGAERIFVVTRKGEYLPLLRDVGIDVVISPRLVAASRILTFIRHGRVLQVAALGEAAEALEFEVAPRSPAASKPLNKLSFPRNAIVVAALRGAAVTFPGGDDQLEMGDRAIVFAMRSAIPGVEKIFSGETSLFDRL